VEIEHYMHPSSARPPWKNGREKREGENSRIGGRAFEPEESDVGRRL
jgi:hypothetical protein